MHFSEWWVPLISHGSLSSAVLSYRQSNTTVLSYRQSNTTVLSYSQSHTTYQSLSSSFQQCLCGQLPHLMLCPHCARHGTTALVHCTLYYCTLYTSITVHRTLYYCAVYTILQYTLHSITVHSQCVHLVSSDNIVCPTDCTIFTADCSPLT